MSRRLPGILLVAVAMAAGLIGAAGAQAAPGTLSRTLFWAGAAGLAVGALLLRGPRRHHGFAREDGALRRGGDTGGTGDGSPVKPGSPDPGGDGAARRDVNARTLEEPGIVRADGSGGGDRATRTPESSLIAILGAVDGLRAEWPRIAAPAERLRRALAVLTDVQDAQVPAFIAGRPALSARLGLGGYADLMDRFAAAERRINRAWSAAADGFEPEVLACLDEASALLAQSLTRLE